jgi:hypothetical protein
MPKTNKQPYKHKAVRRGGYTKNLKLQVIALKCQFFFINITVIIY